MMAIERSRPIRPAWLYPGGTVLRKRNGRAWAVSWEEIEICDEDGRYLRTIERREWVELGRGENRDG